MNDYTEAEFHNNKLTGKTYVSKRITTTYDGTKLRIASKVFDGDAGYEYATEKDELVLRRTPAGRKEIKVKFLEDSRGILTLTIQKFNKSGPGREYFTFIPEEITALLNFVANIRRVNFPDAGKINVTDDQLDQLLISPHQAERVFRNNPGIVAALARTEVTSEDIIALGYRRQQLELFENLLTDTAFFSDQASNKPGGPEGVWQEFFETNPWVFGYGLSYIFNTGLNDKKLEQVVKGFDLTGRGKRVDAVLKSQAAIQSLCFVEIKRHDTGLLSKNEYRPGVWAPSAELCGAVAQVQGTVHSAAEAMGSRLDVYDNDGDPTGELLHTIQPRSYVVCGSLEQFDTERGVNSGKFRSFELYRRNIHNPEIITFDELYHRARYIVETAS